jgi:predicted small secreted protein
MRKRSLLLLLSILPLALLLSACTAKGYGKTYSMLSTKQKVSFSLYLKSTNVPGGQAESTLKGQYYDPKGMTVFGPREIKFEGIGKIKQKDKGPRSQMCVAGAVQYASKNRYAPGKGNLNIMMCDNGDKKMGSGDSITVSVLDGPYTGYFLEGTLTDGNIVTYDD